MAATKTNEQPPHVECGKIIIKLLWAVLFLRLITFVITHSVLIIIMRLGVWNGWSRWSLVFWLLCHQRKLWESQAEHHFGCQHGWIGNFSTSTWCGVHATRWESDEQIVSHASYRGISMKCTRNWHLISLKEWKLFIEQRVTGMAANRISVTRCSSHCMTMSSTSSTYILFGRCVAAR